MYLERSIHTGGVDVDKKVEPFPQLAGWEGWEQDGYVLTPSCLEIQTTIQGFWKRASSTKTRSDYVESERNPICLAALNALWSVYNGSNRDTLRPQKG